MCINLKLDLNDLASAVVNVANDSIAIYDADAGVTSKEAISDLMLAVAGGGINSVAGVLSVNIDDSSIEDNAGQLRVKALGITDGMLAGSISDAKMASDYVQTSEVDDVQDLPGNPGRPGDAVSKMAKNATDLG